MKKLAPKEAADLLQLRDRILLTLQFMDDAEDFGAFGQQLREVAQTAFAKGDLRAMRLIAKQVDSFTVGLAPHQRDGLEALLSARLGVNKDAERAELKERVAAVLARGRIDSEKQRRKLEDYLEMLEATGGDPEEAAAVKRLLAS